MRKIFFIFYVLTSTDVKCFMSSWSFFSTIIIRLVCKGVRPPFLSKCNTRFLISPNFLSKYLINFIGKLLYNNNLILQQKLFNPPCIFPVFLVKITRGKGKFTLFLMLKYIIFLNLKILFF